MSLAKIQRLERKMLARMDKDITVIRYDDAGNATATRNGVPCDRPPASKKTIIVKRDYGIIQEGY